MAYDVAGLVQEGSSSPNGRTIQKFDYAEDATLAAMAAVAYFLNAVGTDLPITADLNQVTLYGNDGVSAPGSISAAGTWTAN